MLHRHRKRGRSALDAVILTTMGLEFLREHMLETNRIHYIISNGGTAANSVPDLATLNVELRQTIRPTECINETS